MKQYQYQANEHFFDTVFKTLNEGGVYGWASEQKFFTKEDGKLVAQDQLTYDSVALIVRPEYLKKRFIFTPNTNQK